jgi:hypothetical protein
MHTISEQSSQSKKKQLHNYDWFDSISRLAMCRVNLYKQNPEASENLLFNGLVCKEIYSLIYNVFLSKGLIKKIEDMEHDEKLEWWREYKSLEKKYCDHELPKKDSIKIIKSIYLLSCLSEMY